MCTCDICASIHPLVCIQRPEVGVRCLLLLIFVLCLFIDKTLMQYSLFRVSLCQVLTDPLHLPTPPAPCPFFLFLQQAKQTSVIPTGKWSSGHHQRCFFLLQETITESHNRSKCGVSLTMAFPLPVDISTIQPVHLRLRQYHGRKGVKIIRAMGPGCLL